MLPTSNKEIQKVGFNTKVLIEVNRQEQLWEIVKPEDVNVAEGKISYEAPLVRLILGLQEGESGQGFIHDRKVSIIVKEIEILEK